VFEKTCEKTPEKTGGLVRYTIIRGDTSTSFCTKPRGKRLERRSTFKKDRRESSDRSQQRGEEKQFVREKL